VIAVTSANNYLPIIIFVASNANFIASAHLIRQDQAAIV